MSDPVPFSQAPMWARMTRFYGERGVEAWSKALVPTFISTNAWLARAYARMIADWVEHADVEPDEPVYVLELGAGTGTLSAHIARTLEEELLPGSPRVVMVVTDNAESSLAHAAAHPRMARLIAEGRIDFARLDLTDVGTLHLRSSGVQLSTDAPGNPVGVLANYIIDSLPCELIRVRGGDVHDVHVREAGIEDDAMVFEGVEVPHVPFDDAVLDDLVEAYRTGLDDAHVLIPHAALWALRDLLALGGDRGLILVGDKSVRDLKGWEGEEMPYVAVHGEAISVHANTHAIGHLVRALDGVAWHTDSADSHFTVSGFAVGIPAAAEPPLSRAWRRHLGAVSPTDVSRVWDAISKHRKTLSLPRILAALRLVDHDPRTFLRLSGRLMNLAGTKHEERRADLRLALDAVEARMFEVDPDEDLPFELGRLAWALDLLERAEQHYLRSLDVHGPHPATFTNLALVAEADGRPEDARGWCEQALELEPDRAMALEILERLDTGEE